MKTSAILDIKILDNGLLNMLLNAKLSIFS